MIDKLLAKQKYEEEKVPDVPVVRKPIYVNPDFLEASSVLNLIKNLFPDEKKIKKELIGKIVMTRYSSFTYKIEDIDFKQSPASTFQIKYWTLKYAEYYKK